MGTKGKDVGGGMPGLGKSFIAGSHGTGKYGQPHKFYDKSMAKYKGPHKELEPVPADKQKSLGQLPTETRNNMGFEKYQPKKMSQDHKMAYDRSEISRLKGDIHDDDLKKKGKGPNKMMKDKQKESNEQDDVLAGMGKYKCGK